MSERGSAMSPPSKLKSAKRSAGAPAAAAARAFSLGNSRMSCVSRSDSRKTVSVAKLLNFMKLAALDSVFAKLCATFVWRGFEEAEEDGYFIAEGGMPPMIDPPLTLPPAEEEVFSDVTSAMACSAALALLRFS